MECLKSTPWETRNIGVESFVVDANFYQAPDEQKLFLEISRLDREHGRIFIYARVEKLDRIVNSMLERVGFSFVEQTLEPHVAFSKAEVLHRFLREPTSFLPKRFLPDDLQMCTLDKNNKEVCEEVFRIAGASFSDDRFHLDPKCDGKIADSRFVYWVQDLLNNHESVFHLLRYKGELTGFMARKAEHLVLAGFSRKHIGSGLGEFLWLSVLSDMRELGMSHAHTLISVNNVSVLNLYARLGFKFRNPAATFHYWG